MRHRGERRKARVDIKMSFVIFKKRIFSQMVTIFTFSEQQLVDCDPNNNGCNGGWYTSAWSYLKGGSAKQSTYSYTAVVCYWFNFCI